MCINNNNYVEHVKNWFQQGKLHKPAFLLVFTALRVTITKKKMNEKLTYTEFYSELSWRRFVLS